MQSEHRGRRTQQAPRWPILTLNYVTACTVSPLLGMLIGGFIGITTRDHGSPIGANIDYLFALSGAQVGGFAGLVTIPLQVLVLPPKFILELTLRATVVPAIAGIVIGLLNVAPLCIIALLIYWMMLVILGIFCRKDPKAL